jgi:putative Mn2+ efflux pump MntP
MNVAMIMLVGFGLAFDVFYIAVSQGCVLGTVRA